MRMVTVRVCECVWVLASPFSKLAGKLKQVRWECQHKISTPAGGRRLGAGLPGMQMQLDVRARCGLWISVCVHFDLCLYITNMFLSARMPGASVWVFFLGGREVSVLTVSAVLNCGGKRADSTGVDVWHDLSQQARCRELGAAACCVRLC